MKIYHKKYVAIHFLVPLEWNLWIPQNVHFNWDAQKTEKPILPAAFDERQTSPLAYDTYLFPKKKQEKKTVRCWLAEHMNVHELVNTNVHAIYELFVSITESIFLPHSFCARMDGFGLKLTHASGSEQT